MHTHDADFRLSALVSDQAPLLQNVISHENQRNRKLPYKIISNRTQCTSFNNHYSHQQSGLEYFAPLFSPSTDESDEKLRKAFNCTASGQLNTFQFNYDALFKYVYLHIFVQTCRNLDKSILDQIIRILMPASRQNVSSKPILPINPTQLPSQQLIARTPRDYHYHNTT